MVTSQGLEGRETQLAALGTVVEKLQARESDRIETVRLVEFVLALGVYQVGIDLDSILKAIR